MISWIWDSIREILERHERYSDALQIDAVLPRDLEYWSKEAARLKEELDRCHQTNRHMLGEDLSALNLKELEELQEQLDAGLRRIRSKKNHVLLEQIDELTKKESFLREENRMLRSKVAETEEKKENMPDDMNMETREPPSIESAEEQRSLQLNHRPWRDSHNLQFALQLGPYQPPPSTETPTGNHRHN
ncbi:hypothetical protein O6H91_18G079100 [Diphasiastrum complanatum]|nr:hypothetical protein O6H91_18G079100 [Diphasiastrum complanatum]